MAKCFDDDDDDEKLKNQQQQQQQQKKRIKNAFYSIHSDGLFVQCVYFCVFFFLYCYSVLLLLTTYKQTNEQLFCVGHQSQQQQQQKCSYFFCYCYCFLQLLLLLLLFSHALLLNRVFGSSSLAWPVCVCLLLALLPCFPFLAFLTDCLPSWLDG